MTSWESVRWTQKEFRAELVKRFGPDWRAWAFECPHCGDVATGADFEKALLEVGMKDEDGHVAVERYLGQRCIGRVLGALKGTQEHWQKSGGRGCDWVAFGLFRGPDVVVLPDDTEVWAFKIAEKVEVESGV